MSSSIPLDLVVAATGASTTRAGATRFSAVSHDGRQLPKDALYIAIRGERVDGHDFVAQAEESGAAGVVVARGRGAAAVAATKRCAVFEVDDPILALGRLARAWRRGLDVKIVALTGSVGKTSTKEMLAAILAASVGEAAVHKTRGNLNNHLGVPLTLLGLTSAHKLAVVELGMSSLGEIAYLEALTRPDVCVVTRVDGVHLEQLGTIENVGRAKGEIFEGQASTGAAIAIVPHGERLLEASLRRVPASMRRSFGGTGADVSVREARLEADGTRVVLAVGSRLIEAKLGILGVHHAHNAAAATAAALALGVEERAIVAGLAAVRSEKHRMQLSQVGGRTLIDDCYNASPPSVRAALDVLATIGDDKARRVAILGDMFELGPGGPAEHAAIGRYAAERANEVIGLGALSRNTVDAAREKIGAEHAVHAVDAVDAAKRAFGASRAGDVLLVKGSRGMKLERVIEAIEQLAGEAR